MRNSMYLFISVLMFLIGCEQGMETEEEESVMKGESTNSDRLRLDNFELPDRAKGFFWEGTDGDNQFYFLGTIHIGTKDMYPLDDEIELAFKESDFLLLEQDPSSTSYEEFRYYQGDERLEDHLPKELMDLIREYSKESPMTFGNMNQMKPYELHRTISYNEIEKNGLKFEYGVEQYLIANQPANMEIIGLEGRESAELLFGLSDDYYAYMLHELLDDLNKPVNDSIKSYVGYLTGDETMLQEIERDVDGMDGDKEYEQMRINHVMVKRDSIMADRIVELSEEQDGKTFFVAIGTAHYFNSGNVLELLKDEGFEIERRE